MVGIHGAGAIPITRMVGLFASVSAEDACDQDFEQWDADEQPQPLSMCGLDFEQWDAGEQPIGEA